ncbi:hypothetical protein D3C86_1635460 [compost metagenome]
MVPVLLTTVLSSLPAACAVSSTWPPSAWIKPPLLTSALTAPWSTVTLSRPSPATSSVTACPPTSATEPMRAAITPSLLTWAPSRATWPPGALIVPWLLTDCALLPENL